MTSIGAVLAQLGVDLHRELRMVPGVYVGDFKVAGPEVT